MLLFCNGKILLKFRLLLIYFIILRDCLSILNTIFINWSFKFFRSSRLCNERKKDCTRPYVNHKSNLSLLFLYYDLLGQYGYALCMYMLCAILVLSSQKIYLINLKTTLKHYFFLFEIVRGVGKLKLKVMYKLFHRYVFGTLWKLNRKMWMNSIMLQISLKFFYLCAILELAWNAIA